MGFIFFSPRLLESAKLHARVLCFQHRPTGTISEDLKCVSLGKLVAEERLVRQPQTVNDLRASNRGQGRSWQPPGSVPRPSPPRRAGGGLTLGEEQSQAFPRRPGPMGPSRVLNRP